MSNIGLVICCGKPPQLGNHNLHSYEGKTGLRGWGYYCDVCGKSASVIGGGAAFAAEHWNRLFQPCKCNEGVVVEPKLNAPDGWRWAVLNVRWTWMGGEMTISHPHILFWTANPHITKSKCGYECWIDESRHHRDLRLMNLDGHEEDLSWLGKHKRMSAYAHTGTGWCTDNTSWFGLYISIRAHKWAHHFRPQLLALTGIDLIQRRNNRSSWEST